jgi:cytochrome c biogenesis factor
MSIGGMGDGRSAIQISLAQKDSISSGANTKEILAVEASVKPFISLVWIGTLLVFTGFIISIQRRKKADTV